MNIDELRAAVTAAGADNEYSIRSYPQPDRQPSDVTVLEPTDDGSDRWVVYYAERGHKNDPAYFDSEDAAAQFVYARLTRPPEPVHVPTADEDERAAQLRAEAEADRRRMLIERGYDPDTMRPLS